jgi:hypothetical protein
MATTPIGHVAARSAVILLLLVVAGPCAQSQTESQVKAALIYNFAQFAEWPKESLPEGAAPLVIGVVGGDEEFLQEFKDMVSGKKIGTHPVKIRTITSDSELRSSHVVFIRSSERKRLHRLMESLEGTGVLSIGEEDNFLQYGGIINLLTENGKIRFQISRKGYERAHLQLRSQLLMLAKEVR